MVFSLETPPQLQQFAVQELPEPDAVLVSNSPWQVCLPGKTPNILLWIYSFGLPCSLGQFNSVKCKQALAGTKPPLHQLPTHSCVLVSCQPSRTFVVHVGLSNWGAFTPLTIRVFSSNLTMFLLKWRCSHQEAGWKQILDFRRRKLIFSGLFSILFPIIPFRFWMVNSLETWLQRQYDASYWESI